MTKAQQNQIIKDAWAAHLMADKKLPADIADTYTQWVQQKIKDAQAQMQQTTGNTQDGIQGNVQDTTTADTGTDTIMEADNGVQAAQ